MNNSLLEKRGHGFVQQFFGNVNVFAKFEVERFSRFRTGDRQVFTT